jgi:hypothetical protein
MRLEGAVTGRMTGSRRASRRERNSRRLLIQIKVFGRKGLLTQSG